MTRGMTNYPEESTQGPFRHAMHHVTTPSQHAYLCDTPSTAAYTLSPSICFLHCYLPVQVYDTMSTVGALYTT